MVFQKIIVAAALIAPAAAAGGLRARNLAIDDLDYAVNTCADSMAIFKDLLPIDYAMMGLAEDQVCVKWPSIYDEAGDAHRPGGLLGYGICFCDNYCDAADDCCIDFCTTCAEYPTPEEDITRFDANVDYEPGDDIIAAYAGAPQIAYPKGQQFSGDDPEYFFPMTPLCIDPSAAPTPMPSGEPTAVPTADPTSAPSDTPSMMPSDAPTRMPSDTPTRMPSDTPTPMPSDAPSIASSGVPSPYPSDSPTMMPSDSPTLKPSESPSPATPPPATLAPVKPSDDDECTLDIPFEEFNEAFPWIQYEESVGLGRLDGGDFTPDGRAIQWLMSVDKINDATVLPWADSSLSILPDVDCDGAPLVSETDTATDLRFVDSSDPCDWIPYIANGWDQLPKCVVDPHLDRHRANARHLKAIDMAMQRRQDCCRDCSPLNAVQYARTTVVLDSEAYPEGVETTVYFVGNDGAAFWVNGFRAYDENICSAAITGFLKPVAVFLQPGDNVFTVKARNHGIMMKELNHGFIMRFDTELIPNLTLSLAKPTAPPVPDFNFP